MATFVDFTDQLHFLTGILIGCLALLNTVGQFIVKSTDCWAPATSSQSMIQYTNSYCGSQHIYWLPLPQPRDIANRNSIRIATYHWTPFILVFQGMSFWLVDKFCNAFISFLTSYDLHKLILRTKSQVDHRTTTAETDIQITVDDIQDRKRSKFGLALAFLNAKSFRFCNIIAQYMITYHFVGASSYLFGFEQVINLWYGFELDRFATFPIVTLCNFEVRVLENVHHHSVQCVTSINDYNTKMFICLSCLIGFLTCLTLMNNFAWFVIIVFPGWNHRFILKYIRNLPSVKNSSTTKKFTELYLKKDSIILLRILSTHSPAATKKVVFQLWNTFINIPANNKQEHAKMTLKRDFELGEIYDLANEVINSAISEVPSITNSGCADCIDF